MNPSASDDAKTHGSNDGGEKNPIRPTVLHRPSKMTCRMRCFGRAMHTLPRVHVPDRRSYHQGPVVCVDSGGADAWSWSPLGADDRSGVPLLPPGQCNLPRKASTVMALVNDVRTWIQQNGRCHWGKFLTLQPPASEDSIQTYLDTKRAATDGPTVLALTLEVPCMETQFIRGSMPFRRANPCTDLRMQRRPQMIKRRATKKKHGAWC